jgi:hypothetical protein
MSTEKPGTQSPDHLPSGDSGEARGPEKEHVDDSRNLEQRRPEDPDLSLDVPQLNIEEISLELHNLLARVALNAQVADFVKINVGVDIRLEEVKLAVKGLEAKALLEVKMEKVLTTLNRALEAIDNNPQVLDSSSRQPQREAGESPDGTTRDDNRVTNITEAARQEAERLGVDLSDLAGSGRNGRILVKDVQRAARNRR